MQVGAKKRLLFCDFRQLDFFFRLLHRADLSKRWRIAITLALQ
jgi:hypothetical protein